MICRDLLPAVFREEFCIYFFFIDVCVSIFKHITSLEAFIIVYGCLQTSLYLLLFYANSQAFPKVLPLEQCPM